MTAFAVRIERLPPMTVASAHAYGENPERAAWQKLEAWAGPLGLLDDPAIHPVFGFNNPDPSPDRQAYGYEFWVAVEPDCEAGPGIELKQFEGGLYAVASCRLADEMSSEFFLREGYLEAWQKLLDWATEQQRPLGNHQALEKPRDPAAPEDELILDLYLPIED